MEPNSLAGEILFKLEILEKLYKEESQKNPSRELSIALTHLQTSRLWIKETPVVKEENYPIPLDCIRVKSTDGTTRAIPVDDVS